MRSLLTGGIKAILAIAALSVAAHWALRTNRDPATAPIPASTAQSAGPSTALAALPDPVSTGSIVPRKVERPPVATASATQGLDQQHLLKLISGTSTEKKSPGRSTVAKR